MILRPYGAFKSYGNLKDGLCPSLPIFQAHGLAIIGSIPAQVRGVMVQGGNLRLAEPTRFTSPVRGVMI